MKSKGKRETDTLTICSKKLFSAVSEREGKRYYVPAVSCTAVVMALHSCDKSIMFTLKHHWVVIVINVMTGPLAVSLTVSSRTILTIEIVNAVLRTFAMIALPKPNRFA